MRRTPATSPPADSGDGPSSERGNFTPPAASRPPAGGDGGRTAPDTGSRLAPRNWRVATRLNAILLLPVIVALVFAGLRVQTHYETWQAAERAERTAELVRASTAYANALLDERDLTARPLLAGDTEDPVVEQARQDTDRARTEFEARAADAPDDENIARRLARVEQVAPRLATLRQVAYTDELPGVQTEMAYVEIQHPVMSFANELGLTTGNLASYGRSVYTISLGQAATSLQRSVGTHLLVADDADEAETAERQVTLSSYLHLEGIARNEYVSAAGPGELELLERALAAATGDGPDPVDEMAPALVTGDLDPQALADAGITPDAWFTAVTARFDAYRDVERDLVDRAVDEAQSVSADARTDMITNSVLVVVLLLAAFAIAALMARAMSKSMSRLRDAALGVAEKRLPALVDQLSRNDPGHVDTRVEPIRITSRDEIGEVSRAFDQVHREAVRLAAEQALLRGNVNAMFTNLSSRNQGLVERQLGLIGELENNEAEPDQLENLFQLDHLATRMRRNGENLLVLAGEEPGRRWNQPVPLVDVVRAAASEVEYYDRVDIVGIPPGEIHGAVVTDLVHLLAELLENATSFSSPHTKVRVTATRLPDGRVMVEIHDKGVGLSADDFALINHRLADPPVADVEVSRRMGLFVVGRLSLRHGIRVQLRPSGEQVGTTSLVMLPESITHGGGGDHTPEEEFTVSRIVPEGPYGSEAGDAAVGRTAAELGFDDSRYADGGAALDPVRRSLRRGERRIPVDPAVAGDRPRQTPVGGPVGSTGHQEQTGHAAGHGHGYGVGQGHHDQGQNSPGHGGPGYGADTGYGGYPDSGGPAPGTYAGYTYPAQAAPGYGNLGADPVGQPGAGEPMAGYAPPGYPEDGRTTADPTTGSGAPGRHGDAGLAHDGAADLGASPPHGAQGTYSGQEYGGSGVGPDQAYGAPGGRAHPRPQRDGATAKDANTTPGQQWDRADAYPATPPGAAHRVGFHGAGSGPEGQTPTTGAGLPRREPQRRTDGEVARPGQRTPAETPVHAPSEEERGRGPRREAQPTGTTSSGLPRRVPKANLAEHKPAEPPVGGTQVSRAPEDVRGRLTNLHRGVRQGRGASTGRTENDYEGYGPGNDQER
nr:nitrate- and nitrite sensing domain-containing protein [Streptomyces otsuchiensis]